MANRLLKTEASTVLNVLAVPHKYLDFLCVHLHRISGSWFMVHLFSCLLPCSVSNVDTASWGLNTLSGPLREQSIISVAHLPARRLATLMRLSQPWISVVYLHTGHLGTSSPPTKSCYTSLVKVFSIILVMIIYLKLFIQVILFSVNMPTLNWGRHDSV